MEGYVLASIAPMLAVIFTNPFDVAKCLIQLETTSGQAKKYRGTFDALLKIYSSAGVRGLEKGLAAGAIREGSKNFFRIGMYQPVVDMIHNPADGPAPISVRLFAGLVSGLTGSFVCNPFELVKTRLQAQIRIGAVQGHYQHQYTGTLPALKSIYAEGGVSGLFASAGVNMMRSAIGTPVNLTGYTLLREKGVRMGFKENSALDLTCSFLSSIATAYCMNPVDVVRTRMYNQPHMYKGALDCAARILHNEGPMAFMKGSVGSFLRLGPHFSLTFVFLEQMRRSLKEFRREGQ